MPWPDEALQAISKVTILKMDIDCSVEMKSQLIQHMATAHRMASEIYEEYSMRTDRYVCQTPKKYLHFLSDYDATYRRILKKITVRANETNIAIEVIKKCYLDVESMKMTLIEKETMLQESEIESHVLLGKLDELAWEVKKQSDVVSSMHEACLLDTMKISQKVAEAKDDLSKVQPLFDRALRAVSSIKPNDLSEMKKLGKPADIIKLIFDCVSILKSYPMNKVEQGDITFSIDNERRILPFLKDSYSIVQIGLLSDSRFLNKIIQFTKMEKDFINNETVEFMSPYMELECFNPIIARTASTAAEGMCIWCKAMADYHIASEVVEPKLKAVRAAETVLNDTAKVLFRAELSLKTCQDDFLVLQGDLGKQLEEKNVIEGLVMDTDRRIDQAESLLHSLSAEQERWEKNRVEFRTEKGRLAGDIALVCAFMSYCGPLNIVFREELIRNRLVQDLHRRNIPITEHTAEMKSLFPFLVPNPITSSLVTFPAHSLAPSLISLSTLSFISNGTEGTWGAEGLSPDPMSFQNGLLATQSSQFPLIIDPQGQALLWITRHEQNALRLPAIKHTMVSDSRLEEQLEYCLSNGKALIIIGVEDIIIPLLLPILEKGVAAAGENKNIMLSGRVCDNDDKFTLYLITSLPNPRISPAYQSICTLIDFTATSQSIEEQLLGRFIEKEQKSFEHSLRNVLLENAENSSMLQLLQRQMLSMLSESGCKGSLIEDQELIKNLTHTKEMVRTYCAKVWCNI